MFTPPYYEGSHWGIAASKEVIEGMATDFANPNAYPVDGRGVTYYYAFFSPKHLGEGDAPGKQGATAFQRRRHCPLTEHGPVGVAELRAEELAPRAIGGTSIRMAQNLTQIRLNISPPQLIALDGTALNLRAGTHHSIAGKDDGGGQW
jgi:hypothetical protein